MVLLQFWTISTISQLWRASTFHLQEHSRLAVMRLTTKPTSDYWTQLTWTGLLKQERFNTRQPMPSGMHTLFWLELRRESGYLEDSDIIRRIILLHVHPLLGDVLINEFPRRQLLGKQSVARLRNNKGGCIFYVVAPCPALVTDQWTRSLTCDTCFLRCPCRGYITRVHLQLRRVQESFQLSSGVPVWLKTK
jgi:hypothetical protein